MIKAEQYWSLDEEKRFVILSYLKLGKAVINKTGGMVYLRKGEQVKLNIGKSRNGRDYSFSHPHYWRKATWFETFRIKTGLYKYWKVRF